MTKVRRAELLQRALVVNRSGNTVEFRLLAPYDTLPAGTQLMIEHAIEIEGFRPRAVSNYVH